MNLPISESATIQMTLHDYRAIERLLADLTQQLEAARTQTPAAVTNVDAQTARDVITAALPIVQLAVSQLDPRTVRDWPHEALTHFAQLLAQLNHTHDPNVESLAIDLQVFAREAAGVDAFRATRAAAAKMQLADATLADGSVSAVATGVPLPTDTLLSDNKTPGEFFPVLSQGTVQLGGPEATTDPIEIADGVKTS